MEITYHIEVDHAAGRGRECLDSFIPSKPKALRRLKETRRQFPEAYLVKCVQTRCRELHVDILTLKPCRPNRGASSRKKG